MFDILTSQCGSESGPFWVDDEGTSGLGRMWDCVSLGQVRLWPSVALVNGCRWPLGYLNLFLVLIAPTLRVTLRDLSYVS